MVKADNIDHVIIWPWFIPFRNLTTWNDHKDLRNTVVIWLLHFIFLILHQVFGEKNELLGNFRTYDLLKWFSVTFTIEEMHAKKNPPNMADPWLVQLDPSKILYGRST